jgi:hypothetical protein
MSFHGNIDDFGFCPCSLLAPIYGDLIYCIAEVQEPCQAAVSGNPNNLPINPILTSSLRGAWVALVVDL